MANKKTFIWNQPDPEEPYIAVGRDADGFFLNGSGAFVDNFGNPLLLAMTPVFSGCWRYVTDAEVWEAGVYNVAIYAGDDDGASIVAFSQRISGDVQMTDVALASLAARNAVSSVSATLGLIREAIASLERRVGLLDGKVDTFNISLLRSNQIGNQQKAAKP